MSEQRSNGNVAPSFFYFAGLDIKKIYGNLSVVFPTSEGVWRWKRKDDGREFDLPVYNRGAEFGISLCLRILWLGLSMDIDDFIFGNWVAKVSHNPDSHITKQIQGWIHPEDNG